MMINSVNLTGRLVRDVETKETEKATVGKFTLAVDRNRPDEADFLDVVTFNKLAENCANHIGKGRLVGVSGRLQAYSFEDSEGIRRKKVEIVAHNVTFLDWPKDGPQEASDPEGGPEDVSAKDQDELPF